MNNKYIIKVEHPLVRPGLTIETEASERYLVRVTNMLLKSIREINNGIGGVDRTGCNTVEGITYKTNSDGLVAAYKEEDHLEEHDVNRHIKR